MLFRILPLNVMETTMTISRRHLFKTAALTAGTIMSVSVAGRALAQVVADDSSDANRPPKTAVGYQDGPNGDQRCSLCANFVPPADCRVVSGRVTPTGWCHLFVPKNA